MKKSLCEIHGFIGYHHKTNPVVFTLAETNYDLLAWFLFIWQCQVFFSWFTLLTVSLTQSTVVYMNDTQLTVLWSHLHVYQCLALGACSVWQNNIWKSTVVVADSAKQELILITMEHVLTIRCCQRLQWNSSISIVVDKKCLIQPIISGIDTNVMPSCTTPNASHQKSQLVSIISSVYASMPFILDVYIQCWPARDKCYMQIGQLWQK